MRQLQFKLLLFFFSWLLLFDNIDPAFNDPLRLLLWSLIENQREREAPFIISNNYHINALSVWAYASLSYFNELEDLVLVILFSILNDLISLEYSH